MSDTINTWGGQKPAVGRAQPLFTAHRPSWLWIGVAVFGAGIVLFGAVTALRDGLSGEPDAATMAGLSVFFFCGHGALWLLAAAAIRRSRIEGYDRHLEVVFGFRKPRAVRPEDIGRFQLEVQSKNDITFHTVIARDQRGRKRLVRATRGHPGTDRVETWFAEHCPKEWAAFTAPRPDPRQAGLG
ncbi:hypothetical protein [Curtobacterium herbarum]|uniref:Uncharacterized protein n=1 Tax=Curtobacterium herbarum TaxID=150122 RepID=A0ABP4K2E9_9MICO|nr:hypothetical protein [Curtobacterium herbarum]MBM7476078.1 hypothetical protein [Curtobacterium herbarum]MCS6544354.1 hypothetical protein [Curtobacterium herbarum]